MSNLMAKAADEFLGKRQVAQGSTQPRVSQGQTMKAVVWKKAKVVACEDKPVPLLTHPKDAVVRVTICSICSDSDSHIYAGEIPTVDDGLILGHEACGVIESVGDQVKSFKKGDRVVIAFDIACGECAYCQRGEFTGCDATNDSELFSEMYGGRPAAAIFGYSRLFGNVPGSQAQFVRVPFADVNCAAIPDDVPDEKAVYVSDVLCTSLHATELGNVQRDDCVAIWGLGPIGLYAAEWCKIKGAKRVIGIDRIPERLALAREKFGIEVLDRQDLSSDQVIDKLGGLFPDGGVDVAIEAAGFRFAESWLHKAERAVGMETDTPEILHECFAVAKKCARISIIGDYAGVANRFPIGHIVMKGLTVRSGQCPCQKYMKQVLHALHKNEIDPSWMVTHRVTLEEAPQAYDNLFNKKQGFIKVLIDPWKTPEQQAKEKSSTTP